MNLRFTAIVFLVFIALAVFMYTQIDAPARQVGEGAPTATPEALLVLNADDIEEVLVEADVSNYSLQRVAGGWEVDGQETDSEVDGVVERLAELSVIRDLPADRDPADYGFATPTMTVTLKTAAGDEHVLQIGDDTPVDYNVYVRMIDGERIVFVSRGDIERLRDWLETPPLAPTPTPEEPPTVEGGTEADVEGEDTDDEDTNDDEEDDEEDDAGGQDG